MQYYHWVSPALLQKMKPLCLDANHKEGVSSLDTYAELAWRPGVYFTRLNS